MESLSPEILEEQVLKAEGIECKMRKKTFGRLEYEVTFEPSLVEEAQKIALKKLKKEISVPGYRKGKIPDEILLESIPDKIQTERDSAFVSLLFEKVRALDSTPLFSPNRTNSAIYPKKDHPHCIIMEFEIAPQLPTDCNPLEKISQIQLKPINPIEVSELELRLELTGLKAILNLLEEVNDRPASKEDIAIFDLTDPETGDVIAKDSQLFLVQEITKTEWLLNQLLGMKVGEEAVVATQPNQDATEEEKSSFISKNVKVHLKGLKTSSPEQDETLLKFLKEGSKESDEDPFLKIRQMIYKRKLEAELQKLKTLLLDNLVRFFPLEIPKSVFEAELAAREKARNTALTDEEAASEKTFVLKLLQLHFLIQQLHSSVLPLKERQRIDREVLSRKTPQNSLLLTRREQQEEEEKQNRHHSKLWIEKAEHALVLHILGPILNLISDSDLKILSEV